MSYITTYSEYILNETLKTNEIDFSIKNIKDELSLQSYNFTINKNTNNTFDVELLNFNYLSNIDLYLLNLNDLIINRHGWFPSKMIIQNLSGMINTFAYNEDYLIDNYKYINSITITYEAKFDIETDIPKFLYHLSIQEFEKDVLKRGLIPKSKSKLSKHLDRIYLCKSNTDCSILISRMKLHYSNKTLKNKINSKYIIYKIDTNNLNIKLYKDPNYNNGYYSINNIPATNISVFDKEV